MNNLNKFQLLSIILTCFLQINFNGDKKQQQINFQSILNQFDNNEQNNYQIQDKNEQDRIKKIHEFNEGNIDKCIEIIQKYFLNDEKIKEIKNKQQKTEKDYEYILKKIYDINNSLIADHNNFKKIIEFIEKYKDKIKYNGKNFYLIKIDDSKEVKNTCINKILDILNKNSFIYNNELQNYINKKRKKIKPNLNNLPIIINENKRKKIKLNLKIIIEEDEEDIDPIDKLKEYINYELILNEFFEKDDNGFSIINYINYLEDSDSYDSILMNFKLNNILKIKNNDNKINNLNQPSLKVKIKKNKKKDNFKNLFLLKKLIYPIGIKLAYNTGNAIILDLFKNNNLNVNRNNVLIGSGLIIGASGALFFAKKMIAKEKKSYKNNCHFYKRK